MPRLPVALAVAPPLLAFALAGLAGIPAGVASDPTDSDPERAEAVRLVLANDRDVETRHVGIVRARASYPQKLSASVGMMRVRQPADYDCTTVCDYRGLILQAEPGLGGLQLAAGYAVVVGETKDKKHFLSTVFMGYGIKGVAVRSFGRSSLTPRDRTLVGVEGAFTVSTVNFSVGVLRDVSGGGGAGDRWVLSGGAGWGF